MTLFEWEQQRTEEIVASLPDNKLQHVLTDIITHRELIEAKLLISPVVISFGAYQITVNSKQHLAMLLSHHRIPTIDTEPNVDNTKQQKRDET